MSAIAFEPGMLTPARLLLRLLMPAARPEPMTKAAAPVAKATPAGETKKVLIVDDDPIVLRTTAMKLKAQGYAVVTAADAPAALRTARKERPDVILLDLNFPPDVCMVAWDGFLLMSWLRRLDEAKETPVIIITGHATPKAKERSLAAGAKGIFQKPLELEGLGGAIKLALRSGKQLATPGLVPEFEI
jgi:CheY-like chemotaxis protein